MSSPARIDAETGEYQHKAAFIHNFARMVKWPESALDGADRLRVCVLEPENTDNDVTATIYRNIQGKEAQTLTVDVSRWDPSGDVSTPACQIVFFAGEAGDQAGDVAGRLEAEHALTIGETETFASDGGVINFVTVGSKVRFEINPDAAERAGLVINSQLIRLATIVHDREADS